MAKASATPVTEFTWGIAQLERHTADGVVYTAHYTINAADGTYSAGAYGSIGFEQPDADNIIPFADLTPELVIGWVQEKLGGDEKVEEIETALQAQLDEQHAPTKSQGQGEFCPGARIEVTPA
jgi:hypothetical protein